MAADRDTCLRRNHERDGSSSPADCVPDRAVKVIYDEFNRPDADFVVDTDVLPVETAVHLVEERVRGWLADG